MRITEIAPDRIAEIRNGKSSQKLLAAIYNCDNDPRAMINAFLDHRTTAFTRPDVFSNWAEFETACNAKRGSIIKILLKLIKDTDNRLASIGYGNDLAIMLDDALHWPEMQTIRKGFDRLQSDWWDQDLEDQ